MVYILPILEKLSKDPMGIFALIYVPSWELAQHIMDQFLFYGLSIGIRCAMIIGG